MTSAQMFITATIILYLCFVICTGVLIGRRSVLEKILKEIFPFNFFN